MYFDIAMPLTLFFVTIVALFLDRKIEEKLKGVFEEKEFSISDAVLLVAGISVTVSLIVFIPRLALMTLFLFSYSMLLFIFTYIFSNFQKSKARLYCIMFLLTTFLVAVANLLSFVENGIAVYGALAFFALFSFTFIAFLYEENRISTEERWYLAILPSALFILLYLFFNGTPLWFPYMLNLYGVIFAVLIILYLGSLFKWKTALIFATLLTVMDIILVLFTGAMVSAASHVSGLQLPMLITVQTLPAVVIEGRLIWMSLGLGDFFFAGLLGVQTSKRYGKKFAVLSAITMSLSFLIFEAFILTSSIRAFPGTLMIICGWLPLVGVKELIRWRRKEKSSEKKNADLAE